ncbi:CHAT domain-containing protein [Zhouia spongiae]|uniref:CHAT domain-containing protein n=1 Tax=Zhouia spongiae TaxID=2202721 RepID=A0ABY3YNB1_9FLAO|nr:CHAT domain-containing protein [Zhouia spongiae]UNY99312.1 CHAT domain-containing protein [Zhouia spongiae]
MRAGSFNTCIHIALLWFVAAIGHAQSLEDSIYRSVDSFIDSPSPETFSKLSKEEQEYQSRVKTSDEKLALVILQCNLGYYAIKFNNQPLAISSYEKAMHSYRNNELTGYDIIEYCLKPLGNLYTKTGSYTNAENTIKQYLFLAEQSNNTGQIVAGIINLSVVYYNTGNYNLALSLLEQGLSKPNLTDKQKQSLQNNRSANLMAKKEFEKAQAIIGEQTSKTVDPVLLKNAAQLAVRQQNYQKALELLKTAKDKLLQDPGLLARDLAKIHVDMAEVFLLTDDSPACKRELDNAFRTLLPGQEINNVAHSSLYEENTFIDIFDLMALTETNHKKALEWYDLSFYVSRLHQQHLNSQKELLLYQASDRNRSEKCIDLIFENYSKEKDTATLQTIYQYLEKNKAGLLKNEIGRKELLSNHPEDSVLIKEERLLAQQQELINLIIRNQINNNTDKAYLTGLTNKLNTINYQIKICREHIVNNYGKPSTINTSLKQVQEKLKKDNAAMVHYFYGKHHLYQFTILDDNIRIETVNTDKTTPLLKRFLSYFDSQNAINNDISGYKTTALELYNTLGLEQLTSKENILIIPDGLLSFVPFETLLTSETKTINYAKMPFLFKKHNIVYNTSTSFYMKGIVLSEHKKTLGVFPVFENTPNELANTLDEARFLGQRKNTVALMREKASKKAFKTAAADADIIHISSHASGGNVVVPANIQFRDDAMLLNELYTLSLHTELVVLSSCETGIGKIEKGEGPLSLASGFQYAGAQQLLFSLWKINDLSTSVIIQSFYKDYFHSSSGYMANNSSKHSYLNYDNIPNYRKSPYYWGAFVYYGDFSKEPQNNFYLYVVAFIFVLIVILLAKKRNGLTKKLFGR